MDRITTFFEMGGYAAYVWSAYAIAFVVLVLNVVLSRVELASTIKRAHQLSMARQAEQKGASEAASGEEVQQ